MPQFVYRGRVREILDPNKHIVMLDLGFRVQTPRVFNIRGSDDRFGAGSDVVAFVSRDDAGQWTGYLLPGDDQNALAMLWCYPATLMKVVDGDTIDARVDLGCSVFLDERFRLCDISAPEIFGKSRTDPEYARGISAREYLQGRLDENRGAMTIVSSRQGKWRRWLAYLFVADSPKALNFQLVDEGLATLSLSHRRTRKSPTPSRVPVNLDPELRARLAERARIMHQTPSELLHVALTEYLNSNKP